MRILHATILAVVSAFPAFAMNHNLLASWTDALGCSPPQTPLFSFSNNENDDFMFREGGEKIAIKCQAAIRTASGLSWTLHHNQVDKPFLKGSAEALPGNLFRIEIPASDLEPGFYDIKVKLEGLGVEKIALSCDSKRNKAKAPVGICTFGWKPDRMPIVSEAEYKPADFGKFWKEAMDEYRAIPLDLKIEDTPRVYKAREIDEYNTTYACLPPNFDPEGTKFDEVVSYKVSFAGPDGGRVYAWVARPVAEGKHPALVVYPGAGTGGRPRPLDQARHGYVAMDMQVHGLDVECDGSVRYPWYNAPHDTYSAKIASVKDLVWYNIYRRAVRAIDAISSMPEVDASRIAVCGGSQGGRLSTIVSSLDRRVKAAVPCISNSPNMPHLYWTKKCNRQKEWWAKAPVLDPGAEATDGTGNYGDFSGVFTPEMRQLAYIDPLNFASDAKCPVYFNGGLVDPVSPAYSTYAVYLRWGGKNKTFVAVPNHGHDWWAAFDRDAYRWLDRVLGSEDFSKWVNPFTGTSGTGNCFPGACRPFGMVQASPDTGDKVHCGGYKFEDGTIRGFSQTHLNGTGRPAMGDVSVLPLSKNGIGEPVGFDKSSEVAEPGYYAVTLDGGVKCEATATERVAVWRFTWPKGSARRIFVDAASMLMQAWNQKMGTTVLESSHSLGKDNASIRGRKKALGWTPYWLFYNIEFSNPWTKLEKLPCDPFQGKGDRWLVDFGKGENGDANILEIRISLSTVSEDGAQKNMRSEADGMDFGEIRNCCRNEWNRLLSRARLVKGSDGQKKNWYTALYRLFIQPNVQTDVDGKYRGADGKIHTAKRGHYSTFSLWDTFRAAHPLYTILVPERVPGFVDSLVAFGREHGHLPMWTMWQNDGHDMVGIHSVPVIADACAKGLVDRKEYGDLLSLMVQSMMNNDGENPKNCWNAYWENGYVPYVAGAFDKHLPNGQSVSLTMELAYDWWCISRFAEAAGDRRAAKEAAKWADCWKNVFDVSTGFARPRAPKTAGGAWREPFDPCKARVPGEFWSDYTEATPWVYTWHVFQDTDALAAAMGGVEKALAKLDEFFAAFPPEWATGTNSDEGGRKADGSLRPGQIGQYWHGNEPSHHIAYLYSLWGRRDKTAELVRRICRESYSSKPDGLCGNDDCGQMSAWYLFSTMGFYPVNPCGDGYVLGEAQAGEMVLDVGKGKVLRIVGDAQSRKGGIGEAKLNGKKISGAKISHDDVARGGRLEL